MPTVEPEVIYEEHALDKPDTASRVLRLLILFLIVTILSVLVYALIAGILIPPAPRSRPEAVRTQMAAEVEAQLGNGKVWADYAEALYATGDKSGAFETIERARKNVKDKTIREVNNADLHLLLLEGNDAEVVKRSAVYIQSDIDLRAQEAAANKAKGISVPYQQQDNEVTIFTFTLRGTAEANLKRYKDAVIDFTNALKLDPQAADILVYRGWASLRAGDPNRAKQDFTRALQFLPNDPSATSGLEAVKSAEATETK